MEILGHKVERPRISAGASAVATLALSLIPMSAFFQIILTVVLFGFIADLIFRDWHPEFTLSRKYAAAATAALILAAIMWGPIAAKLKPDGPDLQAKSIRISNGFWNKPTGDVPFVVSDLGIINRGNLKSAASAYRMKAWIDGKARYGKPVFNKDFYAGIQQFIAPGERVFQFDPNIIMFNRTTKAIEPGESVIGRVIFEFPNLADIPTGTKIEVEFEDINGRKSTYDFLIRRTGAVPGSTYVPGFDPMR